MAIKWALILLSLLAGTAAQRFFVASPNVFRLNSEETVLVQVAAAATVELYIQDQSGTKVISKVTKVCQANVPAIVKMKITESDLPKSWIGGKLYFNLVAKAPGFHKQAPILMNLRSGTVFIQTDKPIYTPDDKVKYRVIPVGIDMLPLKEKVMIEITNPQGIRVSGERNVEAWKLGFESREFPLGNLAVLGTWTITAHFGLKNQVNSSTTFVVKKYVLPTFLVRIVAPPYVSASTNKIPIRVTARYSFGKDVKGSVRLHVSVGNKEKYIKFYDERTLMTGELDFSIDADKLVEPKEIASFPVGQRLKILAEVTERASGTKEVAQDVSTKIVKTPFTISFEKTVKYFKPSVSFRVTAIVRYPNKRPVKGERIEFEAKVDGKVLSMHKDSVNIAETNQLGEVFFTINIPPSSNDATRINIKVKTKSNELENAESQMTLMPYKSSQQNYILIRIPSLRPRIGDRIPIKFLIPYHDGINQLSYMVLSRGRIVDKGVLLRKIGTETSFTLKITADMAPKCRIVAFFVRKGEMASDSILMDVEDGYKNRVLINTDPDPSKDFRPASDLHVNLKTEGKSRVGLLAVDQSVYYLRNESRVTNEKVFGDIGAFDLGCGLGSGDDNRDVFNNAGLLVITDLGFTSHQRPDFTCPGAKKSRKRRSLLTRMPALFRKCCKGRCCNEFYNTRVRLSKYTTCKNLRDRIFEPCWGDFYDCCLKYFEARGRSINNEEWVPEPEDIDESESQVTVRQFFPETWIWIEEETSNDGRLTSRFTVPDSITTWEITALAMNSETGFGLSNTINIESKMNVFVHIKMPYSAQRLEQVTVYAIVYNFNTQRTRVNLFLRGHSSFCSIARPGLKSARFTTVVNANDAVAFPFTIIPIRSGKSPIEFLAFTIDSADRIIKDLLVVPEGVQEQKTQSFLLDPQGLMQDKSKKSKEAILEQRREQKQINSVELKFPEGFVQDSQRVMVYVTGNLMTGGVDDIIDSGLNKWIQLPIGCGEQTMIRMAPLVYVLRYLYSIKNGVTPAIEKKAYNFMRKGYVQELRWRRNDNSYSVWGQKTPPSTWLSAFVNKVFCQATAYIEDHIDNHVICDTLKYLEAVQADDGSFPERYAVHHREMIGGVSSKLSLTAFVVISLMECNSQCSKSDSSVILKASQYLQSEVANIKSGYIMSLVAYALSLAESPAKTIAFNKLTGMLKEVTSGGRELVYINDGGVALQVESTSYALLAMMKMNKIDSAGPLVMWLTQQRNSRGSFVSTQDTVIALQALSEYSSKTSGGELDLKVTVTATSNKDVRKIFQVKKDNALTRQKADITDAVPGRIIIDTKGKGTAQLQIEMTYNVPDTDGKCEYDVEVVTKEAIDNVINDAAPRNVKLEKPKKKKGKKKGKGKKRCGRRCRKRKEKERQKQKDEATNKIRIQICASHKFDNGSAMTIVEVGLLTGFKPEEKSLQALLENRDPKIQSYEVNDRNVVFYLERVTKVRTCFTFTTVRSVKVGLLQAVPVKVYDYYEPGEKCVSFYRPKEGSELLNSICEGSECTCSQGGCPIERSSNPKTLKRHACLKSDYVFVGQVRDIEDKNSLVKIAFRVLHVYKTGHKELKVGSKLHIYKVSSCNNPAIQLNDEFLVMLKDSVAYVLDKEAFIFKWPKSGSRLTKLQNALEEVKQGNVCDVLPG